MTQYLILSVMGMVFGAMVLRYDAYEREPWWMLVLSVIAGGLAMFAAFGIEGLALKVAANSGIPYTHNLLHAALAGIVEEAAKLAVPVAVILLARRYFNDPMDGLLYGSMAGLGAALFEACWFQFYIKGDPDATLIAQHGPNAVRLLMHTIWAGTAGFALGLIVMKRPWKLNLAQSLAGVMALHFAWDFFVGFKEEQGVVARLIAALIVGTSVIWYGLRVFKANQWSRQMHAPTSKQRLVGKIVRLLIFKKFR